ncbi:MAG: ATP-binding cassette domain-containing protein [Eubacteriales bacterium]|jgi:ABC-2 type transport system ATP-binding protein|nr:ATP-binding cassette domain-containing protein [Eubacteriales bacterium]
MSLKVENLRKTFGDKTAVDNLSFEMNVPGVFGLIGTNGAGKTTTIRMILNIISSDSGYSSWNGRRIARETLSFGYMPEERGIYMKNKVLEQLVYFGMLRGMTKTGAADSALKLMDRLDVSEYKDMTAEKLSKGNQQKIQLITTLIHDPVLLFLDEPFSGLDPLNTEILSNLIDELVDKGKYIVMSSHQMATVEEFCEHIVLLHQGKTVLQGNLREIKAGYGHTNLIIRTNEDVSDYAARAGLRLIDSRTGEAEYKITGDEMSAAFISDLIRHDIYPIKYEITEPSLNEIFIEKTGVDR